MLCGFSSSSSSFASGGSDERCRRFGPEEIKNLKKRMNIGGGRYADAKGNRIPILSLVYTGN